LLVPIFVCLQFLGRPGAALAVFVVAMVSDVFDGLAARLLNQKSKLGGILDPIADKLLLFSALICLLPSHRVPVWLLALIAFRDGMMVVGAVMVKRKNLEIPTTPTRIGKYATFTLGCFIVLALVSLTTEAELLTAYVAVVGFIAATCIVVSTLQYFARFGYLFFAPGREKT
jgi:cardiolipin synthase (CMP-forming)